MNKLRTKKDPHFKRCPACATLWESRNSFLEDIDITLCGYQVNFAELGIGIFLFNHHSCKTTVGITAESFFDLHDGPIYETSMTAGNLCPGYCLRKSELKSCPALCECAFVREILQKIMLWPKKL